MPLETQRLRLGRRSREKSDGLNGKPEAFRTGGGKAACTLYRGVKAACALYRGGKAACALYRGGKAALRVVP